MSSLVKMMNCEIEKLINWGPQHNNKENNAKNVIKDIEKSILELEDMEKNKIKQQ